jgi:hypothetical protein
MNKLRENSMNAFRHLLVAAAAAGFMLPASAAVTFLGTGSIAGTATDQSGLSGMLEDGVTPANQVGGMGSAITWSGAGSLFYATPDRGPADGATTYADRLYGIDMQMSLTGAYGPGALQVTPSVSSTVLLTKPNGAQLNGSNADHDASNSARGDRFDSEGVRVSSCGDTVFVSDEYGPYLRSFDIATGVQRSIVNLPNKFLIDLPSSDPAAELANNLFGRQANRGMEGLAISPNGSKLYGLMQNALLQDGALDTASKRVATNARLLEIDRRTGAYRELLYVLDSSSNGLNEILAINDHEFLVIERDGKAGSAALVKRIYKIDISGATDIHGVKQLPSTGVPAGVTPVAKTLFIDLLDPAYGLAGASFPEKIEGLAFGPKVDGTHRTLVVSSDNDFVASQPSVFFVFGFDGTDLPDFQLQRIRSCP